jgi:hypothetical protein
LSFFNLHPFEYDQNGLVVEMDSEQINDSIPTFNNANIGA